MERPGSIDTALVTTHRALLAERLPLLMGGWLAATIVWVGLAGWTSAAARAPGLILTAVQATLFVFAALLARRRPRHLLPGSLGISVATALAGTAYSVHLGAHVAILSMMLLAVVITPALLLVWPGRATLMMVGATWGPWLALARPWSELGLTPVQCITGIVVATAALVVIAERAFRGLAASVAQEARQGAQAARLQESEARFRGAFGNAAVGMAMVDFEGRVLQANAAFAHMLGYAESELAGTSIFALSHPEDHALTAERNLRLLAGECDSFDLEKRYVRKDGGVLWGHVHVSLIKDARGVPVHSLAVLQDVTLQRRATESLRASERRYRGLVESQQALVVRCTEAGILNFINDAYCRKFGRRREELVGASFVPLMHPDDYPTLREAFARLEAPPHRDVIVNRGFTPEGVRWFEWELASVGDEDGTTVEIQAIGRDVTARRKAENALHASLEALRASEQKLRRLAHGQAAIREAERKRLGFDLHDDVCQELVGICIMIESASQRIGQDTPGYEDLRRAVGYLGEVMEHLRALARELRPLPLRDLGLAGALRALAAGLAPAETRIEVDVPVAIPRLGEETELTVYRIAHEAIVNAVRHAGARTITVELHGRDGELHLEVRDDGRGFEAADVRPEAIGLASMEERALASGGILAVRSEPGRGTRVALTCPLTSRVRVSAA